jgi:transposase InsO family protein
MSRTCFSRTQLYRWEKGEQLDRKERALAVVPETTGENVARVVGTFPHFGGRKGQAYMLYHELGYVGMKTYDRIKRQVKRLLIQELAQRNLLLPAPEFYEHVRPERSGEIWGEDFTDATVEGQTFKVAVVLDTHDEYYLGKAVDARATAALVAKPIDQALQKTGGRGPEKFLLSDNGSQYISATHGRLLTSAEIVQRRIPACVPQYNGCVEGGMRQLKSVFYNVWERRLREKADEEKILLARVEAAVEETVTLMNEAIPRPCLGGVTPADVHNGKKDVRRQQIGAYREREASRQDVPPWKRTYWDVLKSGLRAEQMSDGELRTKLDFFCRQPLRRIARRNQERVADTSVFLPPTPLRARVPPSQSRRIQ